MNDEDKAMIQAVTDGIDAAISEAWPTMERQDVRDILTRLRTDIQYEVRALRRRETIARDLAAREAALAAAQSSPPAGAQVDAHGVWWWLIDGRWTNGADVAAKPGPGVRWLAIVGDGARAHMVGRRSESWTDCGMSGTMRPAPEGTPVCGQCVRRKEVT